MKTLVIGIGNEFRGDDGVGRHVARSLAAAVNPDEVDVRESTGEGLSLMELWQGREKVILVDATQSGADPGTLRRFEAGSSPLPTVFARSGSSHAFSVVEAIELARSLGSLPVEVLVFGVEGSSFELGESLSSSVAEAAQEVLEEIRSEL